MQHVHLLASNSLLVNKNDVDSSGRLKRMNNRAFFYISVYGYTYMGTGKV